MSDDAIDFTLIQGWEPTGKRVRVIESVETVVERSRKLMVRYRRVLDESPPPEKDRDVAEAFGELAGMAMKDVELVYDIEKYLNMSGWGDASFGLACNIAFGNLEEPDKFSYLEKD